MSFIDRIFLMTLSMAVVITDVITAQQSDHATMEELRNMVQQQASALEVLQADMATTKTEVGICMAAVRKQVAFTAVMNRGRATADSDNIFAFPKVITNLGAAYDPQSGIFTAPFSGAYVFSFSMIDFASSPTMHIALMKNQQTILTAATMEGGSNSYDEAATTAATQLAVGDQVTVQRISGGQVVYGDIFCSFSGFLVSPDV